MALTGRLVVLLLTEAALFGILGNAALGAGTAGFTPAPGSPFATAAPGSLATADFDGDGEQDVVVTNGTTGASTASLLLGDGYGGLHAAAGSPFAAGGRGSRSITTGDFNGDGKPDVAIANYETTNVSVLLGDGKGKLTAAPGSPLSTGGYRTVSVATGLFDADARLDLVAVNTTSGDASVLLGDGLGGFRSAPGSPFGTGGDTPGPVAVADFNGDGKTDATVGNGSGNVAVMLGDGKGKLTRAAGSGFGLIATSLGAADFNADGKTDVVIASSADVSVLLGDGKGALSRAPGSPYLTGGVAPASVWVADLNADSKPDVAVANKTSANLSVLLGDGKGGLAPTSGSPFLTGGAGPGALGITDFNADSKLDVAVANAVGGSVSVLLNAVAPPLASFATYPSAPVAGERVTFVYSARGPALALEWDLNGDGIFGDAVGSTATQAFPAPGTYTVSLRVTDLDGVVSTTTQRVVVSNSIALRGSIAGASPSASFLAPFPVVRITGRVTRRGARIRKLTVHAPIGATVIVRCRGRGCPFRRMSRRVAAGRGGPVPSKTVEIARLTHRFLKAGASLEVLVSKPPQIGKYTRFQIRKRRSPLRTDKCLPPGRGGPIACPTT